MSTKIKNLTWIATLLSTKLWINHSQRQKIIKSNQNAKIKNQKK